MAKLKVFQFDTEELTKLLEANPKAEEHIRLSGFSSSDDGKTWTADKVKCNGCNWEVSRLYVRAETREQAEQLILQGEAGLCGECFAQMLSEDNSQIELQPPKTEGQA